MNTHRCVSAYKLYFIYIRYYDTTITQMHNMHIWISYYDVHVCKSSLGESESLHFKPNFFCTYHLINIIFQTCNQYLIKYWCSIKTVYIFIQVFENQKKKEKKWKKWWKAVFEMCNDLRYSNVSKTFFLKIQFDLLAFIRPYEVQNWNLLF